MFALVDANSFYCSAEQVFRPEWRGKPIIVLSNNDGCVVAANRQACALGVTKFEPYFKVKKSCEKQGVIALSSNYELYADLSAKMMQIIGRFAPEQHIYSIDESFLSFEHCSSAIPCLRKHGLQLRRTIWKECRLPVSVGIAPTLTLAKIANRAAKKLPNYQGVCVLDNHKEKLTILAQLDVSDIWGIGRRISAHLHQMGINSALDLARQPPALMRKNFNIGVERIVRELNGQKCISWDTAKADKTQIFSTRSAGHRITDLESLRQALSKHAGIASRKARAQGSLCRVMIAFAANSPYEEKPVHLKTVHRFAYPTADVTLITQVAGRLAAEIFAEGIRFYKFGVGLVDLVDGRHEQQDLFNPTPNNIGLMAVFDQINQRYGNDTLFLAAQGTESKWEMHRDRLSPQYTTCCDDFPKIRC